MQSDLAGALSMIYRFGEFELDAEAFRLRSAEGPVPAEPQAIEFLLFMIRNRDRMVSKDELHQVFWNGRFVSDAALSTLVRSARRVLGDTGRDQTYIETEYGRGFRFAAEVTEAAEGLHDRARTAVPAIAVLPFDNLSGAAENDIIADGLTGELISALARTRSFAVTARHSAFAMRDRTMDLRQAGAALGVDYLLEGSVNRDGDRIRIHVQLVDVGSGLSLWTDRADFRFEGMFDLLDLITERIVGALNPELAQREISRSLAIRVQDRSAWQLFVEAQNHLMAPSAASNERARSLLRQADAIEAGVPRIVAGLALTHVWDLTFGWARDAVGTLGLAQEAVAAALARDPTEHWAWAALGACKLVMRDFDASLSAFDRACEADPHSAIIWGGQAMTLAYAGELDAAIASAERAHRLSPIDPRRVLWLNARAIALFGLGRFAEAQSDAQEIVLVRPDYPSGQRLLAATSARLGEIQVAQKASDDLLRLLPDHRVDADIARLPFRRSDEAAAYREALRAAGLA